VSTAADEAEIDLAWKGYSSAALLPSFLVCAALSLVLLTGGWFFETIRGLGEEEGSFIFFGATIAIWVIQIVRWFYRGASYIYRLTPRHLFIDWGFLYNPVPPVPLNQVTGVTWGYALLGRPFRVGWVQVGVAGGRQESLVGIKRPGAFSELIKKWVQSAFDKSHQQSNQ
jgi:uncharacterized membrane protein YdbT with pleckstrin-like domain